MTREAKIGMLTGLGVIVLVGVLLSEYLGGAVPPSSSTGRMATLPLGDSYRQQIMQPVGVPGMARANEETTGGTMANGAEMPRAFAAVDTHDSNQVQVITVTPPLGQVSMNQPVVGAPVTAVPAGPLAMDAPVGEARVPTIDLGQDTTVRSALYTEPKTGGTAVAATPVVQGQTYVIAAGDSLAKIAKKFYNSSKNSDVHRIVAANPTVLKDENAMLVVGKKLIIPTVAKAPVAAKAPEAKKAEPVVVIHPPVAKSGAAATPATPKKDAPTTAYVVREGDTLQKIAHRLSPNNVSGMVKKIMAINGLKDQDSVQAGDKLKLPAKG